MEIFRPQVLNESHLAVPGQHLVSIIQLNDGHVDQDMVNLHVLFELKLNLIVVHIMFSQLHLAIVLLALFNVVLEDESLRFRNVY